jgi:hypothetical protein
MAGEDWVQRNFGWILLGVMVAAGGGTWVATDSWLATGAAFIAPPLLGFVIWIANDAHTHWQHGSGVNPDGSVKWKGEN